MTKMLYRIAAIVSFLIFVYAMISFAGVVFWINDMVMDKWVAAVGIFTFPFCAYQFLIRQEVDKRFIKKVCIVLAGANVVWVLWSPGSDDKYFVHIKKDKLLPTEYVIQETPNHDTPIYAHEAIVTEYTFYRAVNKYVYVMESVKKSVRGQVDSMRLYGYTVKMNYENKFDNRVYLDTGQGYFFFE
ncbi:hypothetical protein AAIE21_24980 [Paenibacillus sp. 102]|uniref:hypothetical protein n=1 Tax=Paenibacillus sp. 102 TaxID=3120823 RepID=UPI0031BB9D40